MPRIPHLENLDYILKSRLFFRLTFSRSELNYCCKIRLNISIHDSNQHRTFFQAYPSNKPLGNWTRDLVLRVEQFAKWATTAHQPVIFWMSGFTFPTGFLTAVLQTCARQNNVSVDSLSWEFVVSTVDDSNITQQPKVRGTGYEGVTWPCASVSKRASSKTLHTKMNLNCLAPGIFNLK